MERDYYNGNIGRVLEASDIAKMEQVLFLPALERCIVAEGPAINSVYYMCDEPVEREDGLEYRHSFYSTLNNVNGMMQYTIFEEAVQSITLDQLNLEERKIVQSQYFQWYIANGERGTEGINSDKTWQALYEPIMYPDITLSTVSSKTFVFNDGSARKDFSIERRVRAGSERMAVLDRDTLTDTPSNAYLTFVNDAEAWSTEEVVSLDRIYRSLNAVTTKDMADIVGYLEELGAVSSIDRDKFVREV